MLCHNKNEREKSRRIVKYFFFFFFFFLHHKLHFQSFGIIAIVFYRQSICKFRRNFPFLYDAGIIAGKLP